MNQEHNGKKIFNKLPTNLQDIVIDKLCTSQRREQRRNKRQIFYFFRLVRMNDLSAKDILVVAKNYQKKFVKPKINQKIPKLNALIFLTSPDMVRRYFNFNEEQRKQMNVQFK